MPRLPTRLPSCGASAVSSGLHGDHPSRAVRRLAPPGTLALAALLALVLAGCDKPAPSAAGDSAAASAASAASPTPAASAASAAAQVGDARNSPQARVPGSPPSVPPYTPGDCGDIPPWCSSLTLSDVAAARRDVLPHGVSRACLRACLERAQCGIGGGTQPDLIPRTGTHPDVELSTCNPPPSASSPPANDSPASSVTRP